MAIWNCSEGWLCLYIIHNNCTPQRTESFAYADTDTQSCITIMSKLYFINPCEQMKATKTLRDTCLPSGYNSPLRYGPWPLEQSLTKRVIMSVWHTKQQILWHSPLLFSIPFSSSHSRFLQRQRRVSGLATVSAVRDWSQIKVGRWKEWDPHPDS